MKRFETILAVLLLSVPVLLLSACDEGGSQSKASQEASEVFGDEQDGVEIVDGNEPGTAVPEPGGALLLGAGLMAVALHWRRRNG